MLYRIATGEVQPVYVPQTNQPGQPGSEETGRDR